MDEDDILNDALAYYKDSKFDARKKLRVVYKGQPAADTGGVTRQFYTQLLQEISQQFFQGDTFKTPIYNSNMVVSGIMKLVGTVITHSILQGGPGFPCIQFICLPKISKYKSDCYNRGNART